MATGTSTERDGDRWRLFAALPVNDAVRSTMGVVIDSLRPYDWPVKWVDPSLAHLTVRFYGNVPRNQMSSLSQRLAAVASDASPVQVRTSAIGAFPSASRLRVIWIGLDGDVEAVGAIAAAVATATAHIGEPDTRPFEPHITIGRLRQGARPPSNFDAAVNEMRLAPTTFSIDKLQLIRSVLSPSGPTYFVIDEWPLEQSLTVAGAPIPELREHG